MQRWLPIVCLALLLLAIVVYFGGVFGGSRQRTPDELLGAGLHAADRQARETAAVELIDLGPDGVAQLQRLLRESHDDAVRAAAIDGLGRAVDFDSMELMLAALEDDSLLVRGRAGVVVAHLLGRDRRFRPDAPEAERRRLVGFYRDDWKFLRGLETFDAYKARFAQE